MSIQDSFRGDLHTHTRYSDGTLSPEELVLHAREAGLSVLSITDHDSVGGVREGIEAAKQGGLIFIPGVEMTVRDYERLVGVDLHLLGYGIDVDHRELLDVLQSNQRSRTRQKEEIVKRLNDMGFSIQWKDVMARATEGIVTRGHIAMEVLESDPTMVSSFHEVFEKYIGTSGPAYVPLEDALNIDHGIGLIRKCGGIAVLAHPGLYHRKGDVSNAIRRYASAGLGGLEVTYPYVQTKGFSQSKEEEFLRTFSALADELDLIKTSGSDFHIPGGKVTLGGLHISRETLLSIDPHLDLSTIHGT